jgi:hypothetical protein
MKRASIIIALTVTGLAVTSSAFAQTNDHFARQRREAAARRDAAEQHAAARHWGGPTTNHRWYPNNATHRHGTTFIRQDVQFVPVSPFGFGYPAYGYPRYGNPGYGYGGWNPYGGYPRSVGYQHIHIHQQIIKP